MEAAFNATISKILTTAAKRKASNIHMTVGAYPTLRVDENLVELEDEKIVTESFVEKLVDAILDAEQKKVLTAKKEVSFVKELADRFRIRVNVFYQKGFLSASFKLIPAQITPIVNLGLPKAVYGLTDNKSGLIIVTGNYGSGRSTTVASMIEEINKTRKENIVTVEDPIEHLFVNKKSLLEQREVGRDANTFSQAIEYFSESDVDVMAVSDNSESGVIPLILEFASSGRLVIFQMDTTSVIQTIEEVFAGFDQKSQQRAGLLLAEGLRAIICQKLIVNDAIRSLIREGRIKQITTILQSSRAEGMSTMDQSLAELVKSDEVLIDKAIEHAADPSTLRSMSK